MAALRQSTILADTAPKVKHILTTKHNNKLQILPSILKEKIKDLPPAPPSSKEAAILVPIIHVVQEESSSTFKENSVPHLLFTTRSSQLKNHANQISFPGGHLDDELDDQCVIRAALRETREELSPPPRPSTDGDDNSSSEFVTYDFDRGIEVLGTTESIPSMKNSPVTPVVAYFKEEFTPSLIQTLLPGNISEVSKVFTVSIDELVKIESEQPLERLGAGAKINGPVYETEHGKIWGLTAMILKPILDQVLKPVFLELEDDDDEDESEEKCKL